MKSYSLKPLATLKIVLDFLFLLLIVVTIFQIILIGIILAHTEETFPFPVHPNFYEKIDIEAFVILLSNLLSRILFIYALFKFKQLISLFFKGIIYSIEQAKIISIIGKLIILAAVLNSIPLFIYEHFLQESPRTVTYNFGGVDSFWFLIAVGLFFMYLSQVFDNARIMKEENELTV